MKAIVLSMLFIIFSGCTAQALESDPELSRRTDSTKQSVLVELFTSEGCASCPPAEDLLARFEREQPFGEVELITLAFHVDYWDDLGWKDKYASPLFTQRQKVYDRKFRTGEIYTPQMVVDGDIEFIGSREKEAKKAIAKSIRKKKATIELSIDDLKLNMAVSDMPVHTASTIYLAIAEDGLGSRVNAGENKGKSLKHVSVVRRLKGIGRIATDESMYSNSVLLNLDPEWNRKELKVIVFIQENFSRVITGVAKISLAQ